MEKVTWDGDYTMKKVTWNDDYTKCTVPEWEHVKSGEVVDTGFGDDTLRAPSADGYYTLYELVYNETNTHMGWFWEKE